MIDINQKLRQISAVNLLLISRLKLPKVSYFEHIFEFPVKFPISNIHKNRLRSTFPGQ